MSERRLLVFTDLDGTLLDHHTYSHAAAEPALAALAARGVPLMLVTSKTRSEVMALRRTLRNDAPFVVENGGAVVVPEGYFDFAGAPAGEIVLGVPYAKVREAVTALRQRMGLQGVLIGFGDLDTAGVADLTGLPVAEAALAKQRATSEPLRAPPNDERVVAFAEALAAYRLTSKQGGRFLTVQGPVDKALGVRFLVNCFRQQYPSVQFVTAALGDSHNDLEMLRAVDMPVVIRPGPAGTPRLNVGREDAILPSAAGPQGFRQGVETILSQYAERGEP